MPSDYIEGKIQEALENGQVIDESTIRPPNRNAFKLPGPQIAKSHPYDPDAVPGGFLTTTLKLPGAFANHSDALYMTCISTLLIFTVIITVVTFYYKNMTSKGASKPS